MSKYSPEKRLQFSASQASNTVDCFHRGKKLSYAEWLKMQDEGRGCKITTVVHGRKQIKLDIPAGDTNAALAAYYLLKKGGYSNKEMDLDPKFVKALNGDDEEDQGLNF